MRLSPDDRRRLKNIFSPVIVVTPPGDPHRSLCRMPNGEIRFYGSCEVEGKLVRSYISSRNCGLDWRTVLADDPETLGPMVQSPYSGDWLSVLWSRNYNTQTLPAIVRESERVFAIRSAEGPGSRNYELTPACDLKLLDIRQPIPMRSRRRWLCTAQVWSEGALCPVVLRSDDDGRSWQWTILETVAPFELHYPHKGLRWQQYSCEPTLVERGDGSLLLISRTSQDFHYCYESTDAGEHWTSPVPSNCFHATTTMPTLMRLNDGRLLFFWCNTQPLPEVDHHGQLGCDESIVNGVWEDVFTNRDACHAAISEDDGQNWIGFREIGLNEIRDHADFRSFRNSVSNDKSVHQFEALELPEGKVLLAYGQAVGSRRMVIFDPGWLYEKGNREDFSHGFARLSTHVYVKSISGGAFPGKVGHCAWNRTYGAMLVPDPTDDRKEVLHLVTPDDPRLFNHRQGAAWNFPACRSGNLTIPLHIAGAGLRLSLADRWFNPCDEYVGELAQFSVVVTREMLPETPFWNEVSLEWDLDAGNITLVIAGKRTGFHPRDAVAPAGFSNLHIQTTGETTDYAGGMVRCLEQNGK